MKKNIYILAIVLFVLDQFTKYLVEEYLISTVSILGTFFTLEKVHNIGAAWGILGGSTFFLVLISAIALIVLNEYLRQEKKFSKISVLGYGLLMGGILGNLIDRILYGYVIDFLSFRFGSYQFPVFNFADMGIVIGIGFLFIEVCRGEIYGIRNRRRKR